jgi:hypothetical protein
LLRNANLVNFIPLLNGKLRTVKYRDFSNIVNYLKVNGNHLNSFNILPINTYLISSNAWLSGFIDADGNFYVRIESRPGKSGIFHSFRLVQAEFDSKGYSKKNIMVQLSFFFNFILFKKKKNFYSK